MFNMGKYGDDLANEILLTHLDLVIEFLRANGESYAAALLLDADLA
jgi:hypothetical protein